MKKSLSLADGLDCRAAWGDANHGDNSGKYDLAGQFPQKADALRKLLHDWHASVGAQMPTANPDDTPEKTNNRKPGQNDN